MTTNFSPGTPSWVDLGTTDVAGATAFYGSLFGWTVEDLGPDSGGYGLESNEQLRLPTGRWIAGCFRR